MVSDRRPTALEEVVAMGPEAIAWLVLGATTVVAGTRARRSRRAMLVGRYAIAALFVLAGALVNALYLATGRSYAAFADGSAIPFVRDTWESVVVPNQVFWIGLLVVFEAAVGVLVLLGGRSTRTALVLLIGFHVTLLSFGWLYAVWSAPMVTGFVLLLRAERAAAASGPPTGADARPAPRLEPVG